MYKISNIHKKGTSPLMLLMFAILVGVAVLVVMNFRGASDTPRTLAVQQQGVSGGQVGQLPINLVEDVTVTFSAKDASDESVNVGGAHQYRICNAGGGSCGSLKTVANLGTDTASPGDIIEVLFANGNNSGSVVYLGTYKTFTLPDKGTFEAQGEVWRNGTITIEVFNEEGNLIDTVVENETLGTGDAPTLSHKIKGTQDRGQFAYGGCMIVEYNQTAYDEVKVTYDGVSSRISTPSYYTVANTANVAKTYVVPPFTNNQIISGSVTPDVKSATGSDPSNSGGDILMNLVPNEYRFNGDAKAFQLFKCGEDQDGNRVTSPRDSQLFTLNVD